MESGTITPRSEAPGKSRPVSLASVPGEFVEQIPREEMFRHVRDEPSSPLCPRASGTKDTKQRGAVAIGGRDGIQRVGPGQVPWGIV